MKKGDRVRLIGKDYGADTRGEVVFARRDGVLILLANGEVVLNALRYTDVLTVMDDLLERLESCKEPRLTRRQVMRGNVVVAETVRIEPLSAVDLLAEVAS